MQSYILHLSSEDSKDVYQNNSAYDFTNEMGTRIDLSEGKWDLELIDVTIPITAQKSPIIHVLCDLTTEVYSCNQWGPVVSRLHRYSNKNRSVHFNYNVSTNAIPVSKPSFSSIRMYIRDGKLRPLSLPSSTSSPTLISIRLTKRE